METPSSAWGRRSGAHEVMDSSGRQATLPRVSTHGAPHAVQGCHADMGHLSAAWGKAPGPGHSCSRSVPEAELVRAG